MVFLCICRGLHQNMDVLGGALVETGQLVDIWLFVGCKLAVLGDEGDEAEYVEGFLEGI